MHKISGGSQLLLVEKGVGLFSTVLRYGDGSEKQLPAATPAKDLIAATEIDYQEYRTPSLDCGFWSWRSISSRTINGLPDVITAGVGLSRKQKRSPGTVTG